MYYISNFLKDGKWLVFSLPKKAIVCLYGRKQALTQVFKLSHSSGYCIPSPPFQLPTSLKSTSSLTPALFNLQTQHPLTLTSIFFSLYTPSKTVSLELGDKAWFFRVLSKILWQVSRGKVLVGARWSLWCIYFGEFFFFLLLYILGSGVYSLWFCGVGDVFEKESLFSSLLYEFGLKYDDDDDDDDFSKFYLKNVLS